MPKTRTIKILGDSQRCPKCKSFGRMIGLTVSPKKSKARYLCEKCVRNFDKEYSTEEIINMGNGFLLDDKWIHEFQRKQMVATGEFIHMKNGIDGAFFATNKSLVRKYGKKLICNCGEFYKLELKNHKKKDLFLILDCDVCGRKKFTINKNDFMDLGNAGIIPTDLFSIIKDKLAVDAMEWDSSESYATPASVLSSDARSRLGMDEDESMEELEGLICPKCGAGIQIEMKKFGKCPTCGAPLKMD